LATATGLDGDWRTTVTFAPGAAWLRGWFVDGGTVRPRVATMATTINKTAVTTTMAVTAVLALVPLGKRIR